MRSSSFRRALGTASAVLVTAGPWLTSPAAADDGGGGARLSPYKSDQVVTPKDVGAIKALAKPLKQAALPIDSPSLLDRAGFSFVRAGKTSSASYFLSGRDAKGKKIDIDMASLDSMTVDSVDSAHNQIRCTVTVFPDVTPAQLVKAQPGFKKLSKDYRHTLHLSLPRFGPGNAKYALVGSPVGDATLQSVALDALPPGQAIRFVPMKPYEKSLWWAIPSVVDDRDYPFRAVTGR